MVTSLNNDVPGRDSGYEFKNVLCKKITYADSGVAVEVGGLPPNALVTEGYFWVTTAFNAGSTNTLDVGYTDSTATDANAYASAIAAGSAVRVALDELGSSTGAPLTRATTVTATYSQTGTAATAGEGYVIVEYVLPDIR